MNRAKTWILILHLKATAGRRESKLLEYLEKTWAAAEHLNYDDMHVIYMAIIPYCSFEYVGESILGLEGRLQTHLTQAERKGAKQKMYKKLKGLGPHRAIWVILETYPAGSTKFHRLFREGLHIWNRDAKLNVLGSKTFRGDPGSGGMGGGGNHYAKTEEVQVREAVARLAPTRSGRNRTSGARGEEAAGGGQCFETEGQSHVDDWTISTATVA